MNLMQTLLEIFRFRSIWRNNEDCVMNCFKIKDFSQWRIKLQISQLVYSHLMKQWKNSCCLSGSEFTSLELNLVTVFSRRCFSFLSNVLSFFFAIKKKEYLVQGLGRHKSQYILVIPYLIRNLSMPIIIKTSNWQTLNQVQGDLKNYCYILQKLILRTGFLQNQRYFAFAQYDELISHYER